MQNAKVMAREKQSEATEKVMFMGTESIEEQFILSSLAITVALVSLSFIQRGKLEVKWKRTKNAEK